MRKPFYGVLLAPTLVLAIYSGQHASPYDLVRPLVVSTIVAAGSFALLGGVTRRWHTASLVVAAGLVAVVAIQFLPLVLVWPAVAWWNARHRGSWGVAPQLTHPLNGFVGAWFGIATVVAIGVSLPPAQPSDTVSVDPGPNVYLIWLDGYPRHDTLMEYFNFDNRPFLDALEHRGFSVAEQSKTDYPSSIQTMATMLQGRPLPDLIGGEQWTGSHQQHRRLWHQLNNGPIEGGYEAAGYTTISIVSPAPGHDWRSADVVLDSPWLSDFEAHLLGSGILRPILPFWAMHRADILDSFQYLEDSAGTSPRFVLAHILKPHDPYVFAADGRAAPPCGAECTNHVGPPNPTLGDRLTGQILWLNSRVLRAVDHIISIDPSAVVVVFSDHGLRRDPNDMDEWFRTLFAARNGSFPDDVSTSGVLTTLLAPSIVRSVIE